MLVDHLPLGQTGKMQKIIDISPMITSELAVFPGDQKFELQSLQSFEGGDPLALSFLKSTVHIGSHADAPSHYGKGEMNIGAVDLTKYIGLAQVIEVAIEKGQRLLPKDIDTKISAPRVLFKTGSYPEPNRWRDDFNSLSPELINYLATQNVRLVGIDTPSIDPANEKVLHSHHAVLKAKMAILEGLVLDKVSPGMYSLIALPLKINDAEASPVRAVLLPTDLEISRL